MKVKLLKEVRKRFSIERYDKVEDPNSSFYFEKTPFFRVIDSWEEFQHPRVHQTYDDAYGLLIYLIKREYYVTKRKTKKIRSKNTKVWYK